VRDSSNPSVSQFLTALAAFRIFGLAFDLRRLLFAYFFLQMGLFGRWFSGCAAVSVGHEELVGISGKRKNRRRLNGLSGELDCLS
jgi:hypothetical protein